MDPELNLAGFIGGQAEIVNVHHGFHLRGIIQEISQLDGRLYIKFSKLVECVDGGWMTSSRDSVWIRQTDDSFRWKVTRFKYVMITAAVLRVLSQNETYALRIPEDQDWVDLSAIPDLPRAAFIREELPAA